MPCSAFDGRAVGFGFLYPCRPLPRGFGGTKCPFSLSEIETSKASCAWECSSMTDRLIMKMVAGTDKFVVANVFC